MSRFTAIAIALLSLTGAAQAQSPLYRPPAPGTHPVALALTSPSFDDGGIIPDKYSSAVSIPFSPDLAWTGAPANTQDFAIITYDLDTMPRKTGPDNLHWLAFNIPAAYAALPEGHLARRDCRMVPFSSSMAATRPDTYRWAPAAYTTIMRSNSTHWILSSL